MKYKAFIVVLVVITLSFYITGIHSLQVNSSYWSASNGALNVSGIGHWTLMALFLAFILYWPLSRVENSLQRQKW